MGPVNGSFSYDGFGRRRAKTIGGTTAFLYDGLNPAQELASGTPIANLLTGLGIDEFFTRTDGAGVRNFLTDALGSSVALADGSGAVQTDYSYEPFGAATVSGATSTNAQQFTGRENDGTGLQFFRARYYDPERHRFVSEDPLGVAGGLNLFAYAANAPTVYADPSGLKPTPGFGQPLGSGPGEPGAPPRLGEGPPSAPGPRPGQPPDNRCPGGPDGWFRPPSHEYVLGRPRTLIWPASPQGRFLEDYIPGAHAAATGHDALVVWLTDLGVPDVVANIPMMPGTYAAELMNQGARSLGHPLWPTCH